MFKSSNIVVPILDTLTSECKYYDLNETISLSLQFSAQQFQVDSENIAFDIRFLTSNETISGNNVQDFVVASQWIPVVDVPSVFCLEM